MIRHVERYGGDPNAVYLVGQSAGGQLSALALLHQVRCPLVGEDVLRGHADVYAARAEGRDPAPDALAGCRDQC